MVKSLTPWRLAVLAGAVACVFVAVNALGQGSKSAGGSAFATVDVQRVTKEYKAMQVAQTELTARQGRANARVQRWVNMPYLSPEEHKELDAIEAKAPASRTAADTARAKELTDKGIRLTGEIAALMQKPDKDLTDADRQRLRDADAARNRAEQTIAQVRDEEDAALRDFGMANQEQLTKAFRASVKKVAEKKGLAIVFDVQVAVYAGVDISDEVIKDLNAK
ncbi:MAG: OmpH family outer membrane protein [Chthonomonadales bacterium]|nr:OmpH family outer membrane protein [Chthonomonadales bacterium]